MQILVYRRASSMLDKDNFFDFFSLIQYPIRFGVEVAIWLSFRQYLRELTDGSSD